MRPVITSDEAHARLVSIFPKAAFDTVLSNPAAGLAVAAMIFVEAVTVGDEGEPPRWARPTTCLWMSEHTLLNHQSDDHRLAWAGAAAGGRKRLEMLHVEWDEELAVAYADNTRETLRDETFAAWREHGALRKKPGVPTNHSGGTWALRQEFADLFEPSLGGNDLADAIERWRDAHMSPEAKLRAVVAEQTADREHEVDVTLPDGTVRRLAPGVASQILRGVIETWAPARLREATVLTISEPGDKVFAADRRLLTRLGLEIDVTRLLPDALLVDLGPVPAEFWLVEAAATDGPIDEARKQRLEGWAAEQNIDPRQCRFLSAFASRNHEAARRRLKDLASGTYAWYLDSPGHELAWYEI